MLNYEDDNGNKYKNKCCGFILGGEYFATCHHLIPNKRFHIKEIIVNFNYVQSGDSLVPRDSAHVDLGYKYLPTQYNFSKHNYDSTDIKTDFLILKLDSRFPEKKLLFKDGGLALNDTLYCIGLGVSKSGMTIYEFSALSFVSYLRNKEDSTNSFISFLGNVHEGFSGTPVYNSNGEIVGIVNLGWKKIDDLKKALQLDKDSPIYLNAQQAFEYKRNFGMGIRAKYILNKYLSGPQ